jgi:hypothetical protein
VKVWLYAYTLQVTSSRRLEQRIREDLAFRYLAGGATPDHWTLNEFRRQHRRAINDLLTQVLELAQAAGLGRLGHVAIDSTRVAANASRNRVESQETLRRERAKLRRQVRRWQQQCEAADPNETAGTTLEASAKQAVEERLAEIPRRLEKLRKAGLVKRSRSDPDSRFLRERQGFTLGYTVTMAVSEDHLIVEQRLTQAATDKASLLAVVKAVEQRCGTRPQKVSADCGFFSLDNLRGLEARGIEGYIPDAKLAHALKGRGRRRRAGRLHHPEQRRLRQRLRSPAGRAVDQRRKALVEPVFGVLKEQRGMRRFRLRGLAKVGVEMALAATAYNLTRLWSHQGAVD